jgi:rubrerythrin
MTWVCTVCGYEMESDTKPTDCPICSAGEDAFEIKE